MHSKPPAGAVPGRASWGKKANSALVASAENYVGGASFLRKKGAFGAGRASGARDGRPDDELRVPAACVRVCARAEGGLLARARQNGARSLFERHPAAPVDRERIGLWEPTCDCLGRIAPGARFDICGRRPRRPGTGQLGEPPRRALDRLGSLSTSLQTDGRMLRPSSARGEQLAPRLPGWDIL